MLYKEMHENFNIATCFFNGSNIVLLFDPKILWKYKYYYFSVEASFGMPVDSENINIA
jgi:hypothetical protein